ncbi:hypothetical protein O4O04_20330 (plasmid) [Leptospira sp. GIMC2001]|nr:hypothetical protein [Leptospira sp. GIMC2001]WCL51466.1 hypothetical protein O4O04_20330 [Leptospira sp. GIMC2001]
MPSIIDLCSSRRFTILIDELDKGWDASEDAKAFVSGLFQSSISINQLNPNLRVFISLRRELYDNIPSLYEDAQKIRDIIEILNWDESNLRKLITNRIRFSIPELKNIEDDEKVWNHIFSENIDYRKAKSFNYMVDRTLMRPREFIHICGETADSAKKNKNFPANYHEISDAEVRYSEERAKDIVSEYRFQYPGLDTIFEIFRGKTYNLNRNELEEICLGISTGEYKVSREATWVNDQDPEYLIDILWRVGFIKAQSIGKSKGVQRSGSRYVGYYQFPNLLLSNVLRFHVHALFRTYLGMRETRETKT